MSEEIKKEYDESIIVPDIDELNTIPVEELPEFDVDAKDIRFEDETYLHEESEEEK